MLRHVTPPGYRCVDAARPIPLGTGVDNVDFQNHGGLAIVYQKRNFDINVTTFECLCTYVTMCGTRVVLLGILLTAIWLIEWNYLVYAGPIRSEESAEGDDSGAVYSRCLVGAALCLTAV